MDMASTLTELWSSAFLISNTTLSLYYLLGAVLLVIENQALECLGQCLLLVGAVWNQ